MQNPFGLGTAQGQAMTVQGYPRQPSPSIGELTWADILK